ncbi:MAG: class I SAM-dependent methyltransferase, partial [Patescibacteria group bacterium]
MDTSGAGGFCVHSFRNFGVFRPVAMDATVPFESQDQCPVCGTELKTYATLVAERTGRQMRLGCCPSCGYAGYRDRPTREWMARFYRDEWDKGEEKEEDALTPGIPHRLSEAQQTFVRLVAEVASDRGKPLCEIGCGDGALMKAFAEEGFRTLIGVESSRHRALLARAVSGFPVLAGDFESGVVAASLRKRAPIGVFASYHVLEHAYHPLAVIRAAGKLQDEGGYLALATPNFVDEPVPTTMFWLPHLHSFTPRTLAVLLAAGGYEIVKDHLGYRENIMVIARKVR